MRRLIGHIIFLCLHVAAVLIGCWPLFITIPLHLIFWMVGRKPKRAG
jgi:hypothetical protein